MELISVDTKEKNYIDKNITHEVVLTLDADDKECKAAIEMFGLVDGMSGRFNSEEMGGGQPIRFSEVAVDDDAGWIYITTYDIDDENEMEARAYGLGRAFMDTIAEKV